MVSQVVITSFSKITPTCRYNGAELAGVIYLHRISDRITSRISKNFATFRRLCGDEVAKLLVIVTNRWDEVDAEWGKAREADLVWDGLVFKPVLEKGARMARHDGSVTSAEKIIRLILQSRPLPVRIQEDRVPETKNITADGEVMNRGLHKQMRLERPQHQMVTFIHRYWGDEILIFP